MRTSQIIRLALAAAGLLPGQGCDRPVDKVSAELIVMGGIPVHVTAYEIGKQRFAEAVEGYRIRVQAIEAAMSVYRSESLVSRANRGEEVVLDDDTVAVLNASIRCARATRGAFDPTVGPLVELWKSAEADDALPSSEALVAARARVGWRRLRLSAEPPHRLSLDDGTMLVLGAVAKGYAADVGAEMLRLHGISRGLVEFGGDLVVFDDADRPRPFTIGIRHPRDGARLLARLRVDRGAVVTSGDSERYVEIQGMRYGHIVNPRTGFPTDGVMSATVLAPTGADADAFATALVVLGEEAGLELVEQTPELEAVLVVADPAQDTGFRVALSTGVGQRFERVGDG